MNFEVHFSSAAQDDIAVPVHLDIRMIIGHAVDVIDRRIGIDQIIEVVIEEQSCVISAGQSYTAGEDVRSSQHEVQGMGAAHGTSGGENAGCVMPVIGIFVDVKNTRT